MFLMALAISSLIIGSIALIAACTSLVIVIGLKNSTHQMHFVPIDQKETLDPAKLNAALNKQTEDYEDDQL